MRSRSSTRATSVAQGVLQAALAEFVAGSVFRSEAATPLDERNVTRSWDRVRRRAQKLGVRPLKLHAARHTFATLARETGRSIRFVAEQLGHANPELTLCSTLRASLRWKRGDAGGVRKGGADKTAAINLAASFAVSEREYGDRRVTAATDSLALGVHRPHDLGKKAVRAAAACGEPLGQHLLPSASAKPSL